MLEILYFNSALTSSANACRIHIVKIVIPYTLYKTKTNKCAQSRRTAGAEQRQSNSDNREETKRHSDVNYALSANRCKSLDILAFKTTLIIIPKSITSNIIQPIKPSSSPATVKIKSFSCSGTIPYSTLEPL